MNRQMMMLGAMGAVMATVAAASVEVIVSHDPAKPQRKRKPTATAVMSQPQERKDKSASLKRMLGRNGRA
jgi:hypothetical protein